MHTIGGQAVIEGVMMKSRHGWSVAVRDRNGVIHLKKEPLRELPYFLRLPIIRGVAALYQALSLGIRALGFSAERAYEEESKAPLSIFAIGSTITISVGLGIGLFILLPLFITKLIGYLLPVISKGFAFNLVDGVVRVFIFGLYIWIIGLWKDIERVFQYHGAEHKVIHAYEEGRELRVENILPLSPHHPRCGTSFLLIVMVVSIGVFSLIPSSWHLWWKFLSRVILIPIIAGLSYEALRASAKMGKNIFTRLLIVPGLALQRLTTREPDPSQIEVAIRALEEVIKIEAQNA